MRASNLKFTTNFPLYRRGGAQGVKKGTAPPPTCLPPDQIFDNRFFKVFDEIMEDSKMCMKTNPNTFLVAVGLIIIVQQ